MKFRELERILRDDGWVLKGVRGSYYQFVHPVKPGKITVPNHRGDLDKRTVKSIFNMAGIDYDRLI